MKASSGSGQTGGLTDWTAAVSGIGSDVYDSAWSLPSSVFNSLKGEATNYISVRVRDTAGNISDAYEDVFHVRKDTAGPVIENNESGGDTAWRKTAGTFYDVNFVDSGSGLKDFEYKAEDAGNNSVVVWSTVAQNINSKT